MSAPIQTEPPRVNLEYEVIKIPDAGEPGRDVFKQQCFALRISVFVHEQGFPLEVEIDEADETATHFLLRLVPSLEPVGTIRAARGIDYYKLGRLVVLKDYRKYRLGRALVLALHEWAVRDARERGAPPGSYTRCIAHSQIPVKAFYARYGYEPEGEEFIEDGDPHQKMVALLRIPSSETGCESKAVAPSKNS